MKLFVRFSLVLVAVTMLLGGCTMDIEATPTPSPVSNTFTFEPDIDSNAVSVPQAQYDGPAVAVIESPEELSFGLVQETYYMENNPSAVSFGEIVGDTDKLMPTGIRVTFDSMMYNEVEFVFDAAFPVAFTAAQYTDGELVDDGGIPALESCGLVEKYCDDGSWSRFSFAAIRTPIPWVSEIIGETLPDTDESDIPTLKDSAIRVSLPLDTPGVYRYTLYFRESVNHTQASMTTGDVLYQLSIIVILPMSDKIYDLLFISDVDVLPAEAGDHSTVYDIGFCQMIRTNIKDKIEASNKSLSYNMTRAGKLERWQGGEWTEIEDAMQKFPANEMGDMRSGGISNLNSFISCNSTYKIFLPELAGEYRITLAYINEYDEKFDLVLYFDIGE